jgi:hypothetical protein
MAALDSTFAFAPSALLADIPATAEPASTATKVGNVAPPVVKPPREQPLTGGSLTSLDKPRPPAFKEPTLLASSIALPDIGAGLRASLSQALELAESAPQAAGRALQALGRVWPGGLASMLRAGLSHALQLAESAPQAAGRALQALGRLWPGGMAAMGAAIRGMGPAAARVAVIALTAVVDVLALPALIATMGLAIFAQPTGDGTLPPGARDAEPKPAPQTAPQSRAPETYAPPKPINIGDLPIGKQQIQLSAQGQSSASTASNTLSQATPLLAPINDGLKQFYYAASGGLAARQAHKPQEQVKLIQGLYSQLQKVVADSNSSIAAVGSAAHSLQAIAGNPANSRFLFHDLPSAINDLKSKAGALGANRNVLKNLMASLGTWLEQAHVFVKGGSHVLPKPPSQLAGTSGQGVNKAAADLEAAYTGAQTALNSAAGAQAPVKTATTGTLDKAAPMAMTPETIGWFNPATGALSATPAGQRDSSIQTQWVNELPAGLKHVADVWVNPSTREVSQTARPADGRWIHAQVGSNGPMKTEVSEPGQGGRPLDPSISEPGGKLAVIPAKQKFFIKFFGGKPPEKSDMLLIAFLAIQAAGALIGKDTSDVQKQALRDGKALQREGDSPSTVAFKPALAPDRDLSSPVKQGEAIVEAWSNYATQIQSGLKSGGVADKLTADKLPFSKAVADWTDLQLGTLKGLLADLKTAKSEQQKTASLKEMVDFKLETPSFDMGGEALAEPTQYDPVTNRPNRKLASLIAAANGQATRDFGRIRPRLGLAPTPDSAAPGSASAVPPIQLNKLAAVLSQPQGAATSQPSVTAQPSVKPGQRPDEKAALTAVKSAIKDANLRSQPQVGRLIDLKFTLDMFLDPALHKDADAVTRATTKAFSLYTSLRRVWGESSDEMKNTINSGALPSMDTDVIQPLRKLLSDLPKPAATSSAEPTVTPTQSSSPALPEPAAAGKSEPSTTPIPTSSPALPAQGDTAP